MDLYDRSAMNSLSTNKLNKKQETPPLSEYSQQARAFNGVVHVSYCPTLQKFHINQTEC
jgi:hypothetical protein